MLKSATIAVASLMLVATINCVSNAAIYQPFAQTVCPVTVVTETSESACGCNFVQIRLPGNADIDINSIHDTVTPKVADRDPTAWLPRGNSLLQNRRAKTA